MANCRKCGVELTQFNAVRHKKSRTGFDTICKGCNREAMKSWYSANRERAKANNRVRYDARPEEWKRAQWAAIKADPERHAAKNAQRATYREKNAEQVKAGLRRWYEIHGAEYYAKNRDKLRKSTTEYLTRRSPQQKRRSYEKHLVWRSSNHERWRLLQANAQNARRGRLAKVKSSLTPQQWIEILEFFDHRCAYCLRQESRLEQEHVIPIARGGDHTDQNVVPACRKCNARKRSNGPLAMVNM